MKSRLYIQLCAVYYALLAAVNSTINTILNRKFKGQNLRISQPFQIVKVVPFLSFLFDLLVFYFVQWSPVLFSSILPRLGRIYVHFFGLFEEPTFVSLIFSIFCFSLALIKTQIFIFSFFMLVLSLAGFFHFHKMES